MFVWFRLQGVRLDSTLANGAIFRVVTAEPLPRESPSQMGNGDRESANRPTLQSRQSRHSSNPGD